MQLRFLKVKTLLNNAFNFHIGNVSSNCHAATLLKCCFSNDKFRYAEVHLMTYSLAQFGQNFFSLVFQNMWLICLGLAPGNLKSVYVAPCSAIAYCIHHYFRVVIF